MANFKKTKVEKTEIDSPALEVKSFEVPPQNEYVDAELSMGEYLAKHVIKKYPEKYIAMPNKDTVRQTHRGWTPLAWNRKTNELREVPIDEAEKSTDTVLAWQPMALRKRIEENWKKVQDKSNHFASIEGTKTQSEDFNSRLSSIGFGKVKAKPLAGSDLVED